ncbi:MAG: hypothetical protein AB1689_22250, partial [Thermodesulfobacteriota bacterium]
PEGGRRGDEPQGAEQRPGSERSEQQPPGRMSPAEARDLLDSLQDDATSLPTLQASQQRRRSPAEEERDW